MELEYIYVLRFNSDCNPHNDICVFNDLNSALKKAEEIDSTGLLVFKPTNDLDNQWRAKSTLGYYIIDKLPKP